MDKTPSELLRAARIKAGFSSAREAAEEFGWKPSGYTHHENGTRGISKAAAQRYSRAFRDLTAADLLGIKDVRGSSGAGSAVLVVSEVAMGVWRTAALDPEHIRNKTVLHVPVKAKQAMRYAVEIRDESVNRSIKRGEYAIYTPIEEDLSHLDGKLLLIERGRDGLIEKTIRMATLKKDGRLKLMTHSTIAKFAEDLTYPSSRTGETISIVGRIVGKYADL